MRPNSYKSTKYRIFAFDNPFNRSVSVVRDHEYIGEAHLIEKLNVVEKNRYKVIQHVSEQNRQHRFYSKRLKQLHSIVLQTDILKYVDDTPVIDNIRYGQAIDEEKDKTEAADDKSIPDELKDQASAYATNYLNPDPENSEPGDLTKSFQELGKQARQKLSKERK